MSKIIEGSKKSLEIANVCYANVAGMFAMFNNPKYRGPNFTWDNFVSDCEEDAVQWMWLNDVKGNKEAVNSTAKKYAKEIAQRLVERLTE